MKILSEGKFREFKGFENKGDKETVSLHFDGNAEIKCTKDHKFLRDDGSWIQAENIKTGETYNGFKFLGTEENNEKETVYDAIEVSGTHSFYAEGLTAHNCNLLYFDEFAHVNQQMDFWESTYPVISAGNTTKVIITSTPNGMDLFYKIYKEATEGKNNFVPIKVHWSEHPDRDEAWKEETLKNIGPEQFKQEFGCEFEGSSNTLISGDKLKTLSFSDPIEQKDNIRQYEKPKSDSTYVMVVDVSRGKGLDYSTFSIIDISQMPYKQVCTFRDNFIISSDFASLIHQMLKLYNDPYLLVEINDIGGQVADILFLDFGYENIIFTENAGRSGKRVSGGFGTNVDHGIRTTTQVKRIGCSILKMIIEQDQLIIPDFHTIQELFVFSKKANSYEAKAGYHDDMVMNLVLFAWLTDQLYFKDLTDINTMNNLREKTEEDIEEDLLPFGFIN